MSPNIKCIVSVYCAYTIHTHTHTSRKIVIFVFTEKVPRQTNIIASKSSNYLMHTQNKSVRLEMQESVERMSLSLHLVLAEGGWFRLFCLFVCLCLCLCYHFCGCDFWRCYEVCVRVFIVAWESSVSKMWCHCWQSWCESHREKRIKWWCQCCLIVCACLMFIVK